MRQKHRRRPDLLQANSLFAEHTLISLSNCTFLDKNAFYDEMAFRLALAFLRGRAAIPSTFGDCRFSMAIFDQHRAADQALSAEWWSRQMEIILIFHVWFAFWKVSLKHRFIWINFVGQTLPDIGRLMV